MGLLSRKNNPPRDPSTRERLEAFVRMFSVPDGLSLEALTEGLSAEQCLDTGRCFPPDKIIDDAFDVYLMATETVRRAGKAARSGVRGCSVEMLVLIVKQALDFARHVEQQVRLRDAQVKAIESVQQGLRSSLGRALSLREQARRVLTAMDRGDAEYAEEVLRAANATDEGGSAAAAMFALATIGRRVLTDPAPTIQQKARLLALDSGYIDTLETLGYELRRGQEQLAQLSLAANMPDTSLYVEGGVTLHLMMQVIEAFEGAHEVDGAIPVLRPFHTQRMVRRMSRLPPPPARTVTMKPIAKPGDVKAFESKINFQGGLGKARK